MFKVSGNKITLTRGDTATLKLNVLDGSTPYDFSSDTVVFSMKRNLGDLQPVIQKTFDAEGQITFLPADTKELAFGNYVYDIQLTTQAGEVDTIVVPSTFVIGPEVNSN